MGVIYLAYHIRLQKYVVIKKLKDDYVGTVNARSEVDMLKTLHHPYLPQVYDFLQIGKHIYTVIDYIEGHDLEWYWKSGYTFTQKQLVTWLGQLLEVLQYLHGQSPKIIHFDIKPANIIINEKSEAVLIDFNISFEENHQQVVGFSREYASPEQMEHASQIAAYGYSSVVLDERTDLYSLAASFYPFISGMIPYVGIGQDYPLKSLNIPYSAALCRVLDRAMEQQPKQRFSTAEDMARAVHNIERSTVKHRLCTMGAAAALLLLLTGAAAFGIHSYRQHVKKEQEIFLNKYNKAVESYESSHSRMQMEQAMELLNEEDYQRFIEEDSKKHGLLLYILADAYADKGDYKNAVGYYAQALDYYTDPNIYRDYAVALAKSKRYSAAYRMLARAELEGEEEQLLTSRFLCEEREYKQALELLQQLEETKDQDRLQQVWELQLICYEELGEQQKAKQCYEKLQEYRKEKP